MTAAPTTTAAKLTHMLTPPLAVLPAPLGGAAVLPVGCAGPEDVALALVEAATEVESVIPLILEIAEPRLEVADARSELKLEASVMTSELTDEAAEETSAPADETTDEASALADDTASETAEEAEAATEEAEASRED